MSTMPDTQTEATVFNIRMPYLQQGQTSEFRARTDMLSLGIKVYAEGGENTMHHHPEEDHGFVILEGEATFHIERDDDTRVVGPYEGIVLPKGVNYWFQSTGEGNLVLLRFGASMPGVRHGRGAYPDGRAKTKESEPWGKVDPIQKPGPGFGDRA